MADASALAAARGEGGGRPLASAAESEARERALLLPLPRALMGDSRPLCPPLRGLAGGRSSAPPASDPPLFRRALIDLPALSTE